jgi:hypothetical protein
MNKVYVKIDHYLGTVFYNALSWSSRFLKCNYLLHSCMVKYKENFFNIIYRVSQNCLPREKREYLGKRDNLNFKEKSPISSDNREMTS